MVHTIAATFLVGIIMAVASAAWANAVMPYTGTAAADRTETGWLGWVVAAMMTLLLLWRMCSERFELRAAKKTRSMLVQGPVTYHQSFSITGENRSRFQVLPEREFGAWPM